MKRHLQSLATDADLCPACERYIGPADLCPYCDADSAKAPLYRHLRRLSLLLALVGTAMLLILSAGRELPILKVKQITATMNFAYVRIAGKVPRKAYISRKSDSDDLSFTVQDDSGSLRVVAYGDVAKALLEQRQTPNAGDQVKVAGSLNLPADGKWKLTIRRLSDLQITPP